MRTPKAPSEPDVEVASGWWRDLENIWTAVGWKDHIYRFNVLYNGTLLLAPVRHRESMQGRPGAQITFAPVLEAGDTFYLEPGPDDNLVRQGWSDRAAPVLWSEYIRDGLVLRQEIFAHIPDGKAVETGAESLFAWVRLSLYDICAGLYVPENAGFALKINAPHVSPAMSKRHCMTYAPEKSKYAGALQAEPEGYEADRGCWLMEDERLVRLAVPKGQECRARFMPGHPSERDSTLYLLMEPKKGNYTDILLPFYAMERAIVEKEAALGYEGALAEAERYWSDLPSTAARFSVPEDYINRAIHRGLQTARVCAEKDPGTGHYSLLTGSWVYGHGLWATPTAMTLHQLDLMGYHADVVNYLAIFMANQGTVTPPGPGFRPHPGYLSTPKSLTSVDWLTDHGAILWAACEHALLAGDQIFTQEWLPAILKACEFIRDARRLKVRGGVRRLMPPAEASDQGVPIQAVWSDGWNYKGLAAAVRLLKQLRHPRAGEFETEAADYRDTFRRAIRARTKAMPTWTDGMGKVHHQIPTALSGEKPWQLAHPFHLDTGPLFPVFSGLMDAGEPLMKSALAWFREGPHTRYFRQESDFWQTPCLVREISSSEPCYSWNLFHSWQQGDRARFLEGMYSLFTGAMSRQTHTVCETRYGITAITPCLPHILLARLSVLDDQFRENELHLLRLVPLAWLKPGKEARFENMPARCGPVTMVIDLDQSGASLEIRFFARWRIRPQRIILHIPPVKGIRKILWNEKGLDWDGQRKVEIDEKRWA